MALDINQLRQAFAKKSTEGGEGNSGFWDKFYPFYKMDFDQAAEIRFLPDLDDENPLGFIVENKYHELMINGQKKRIACLKMYGEACPCCEMSQKHYNEGDEQLGKKFWRKIDYVAQVLVISSPFDYPINPEDNPVRLISIGPKLYKTIESKIVKGDMDELPHDMVNGYNFQIFKTRQGEYADYTTSDFRRKASPVPEQFLATMELYDLKKYRYGKIEREQMETMIEAFLTGKSYEDEKKDGGIDTPKAGQAASSVMNAMAASAPAPAASTPSASAPAASGGEGKLSPQDILAKLKARQQQL